MSFSKDTFRRLISQSRCTDPPPPPPPPPCPPSPAAAAQQTAVLAAIKEHDQLLQVWLKATG